MPSQESRGYHVTIGRSPHEGELFYEFCYLYPPGVDWQQFNLEAEHAQHLFIRSHCPEYRWGYWGYPDCSNSEMWERDQIPEIESWPPPDTSPTIWDVVGQQVIGTGIDVIMVMCGAGHLPVEYTGLLPLSNPAAYDPFLDLPRSPWPDGYDPARHGPYDPDLDYRVNPPVRYRPGPEVPWTEKEGWGR